MANAVIFWATFGPKLGHSKCQEVYIIPNSDFEVPNVEFKDVGDNP